MEPHCGLDPTHLRGRSYGSRSDAGSLGVFPRDSGPGSRRSLRHRPCDTSLRHHPPLPDTVSGGSHHELRQRNDERPGQNETASNDEPGSKVEFLLDDDCGYVLDMASFIPDGHAAYAEARAACDLAAPVSDSELDVRSTDLESNTFMVSNGEVAPSTELDVYDYESQVMYALDDEHGFVVDAESLSTLGCHFAECFEAPVAPTRFWRIHLALKGANFWVVRSCRTASRFRRRRETAGRSLHAAGRTPQERGSSTLNVVPSQSEDFT